ncbi:hypothetical protein PoB_001504800 [Plakobranchus ocellatus]|uniref:Uncharacterized protein n=1 Tax=Plakobranchus ocellatus TaxID=259542 RepID=A0AAV3Z1R3_9GAST|nr:hypothetical protein PoB_001504800 [Plakobranchus ocellatus]
MAQQMTNTRFKGQYDVPKFFITVIRAHTTHEQYQAFIMQTLECLHVFSQSRDDLLGSTFSLSGSVGGTVACESALRSAETLLSQVRAPPLASQLDGGP